MIKAGNNILKNAHQKIIQENYTITTIAELCSSIGVSKKTFYKEHPSKEQFTFDLLSFFNTETSCELEKIIESDNELVIKIIQTLQILVIKSYKKNKIIDCYGKENQVTEFFAEVFRMIFTNTVTKLLEKMNDASVLKIETNYFLFSEVLVTFTIVASKSNHHKYNPENNNLLLKHLLINALKGISAISEYEKIDNYIFE